MYIQIIMICYILVKHWLAKFSSYICCAALLPLGVVEGIQSVPKDLLMIKSLMIFVCVWAELWLWAPPLIMSSSSSIFAVTGQLDLVFLYSVQT